MFRYWLQIQPLNTLGFDLQDSVQDLDMIKGNWDLNQPFGCSSNSKPARWGLGHTETTVFIVRGVVFSWDVCDPLRSLLLQSFRLFVSSRLAFEAFDEIGADDKQPGH